MRCRHCGNELVPGATVCPVCGAPVAADAVREPRPATFEATQTAVMQPIRVQNGKLVTTPESEGMPPSVPPAVAATAQSSKPSVANPHAAQHDAEVGEPESIRRRATRSRRPWILGLIVLVVLALAGAGIWAWVHRAGKPSGVAPAAECTVNPTATVSGMQADGANLVASFDLSDSACRNGRYAQSGVRVNLLNEAGALQAAAVFDFAKSPIVFRDGKAAVKLAFHPTQYWTPTATIAQEQGLKTQWSANATGDGAVLAAVGDALGGANIAAEESGDLAHKALDAQLAADRDAARSLTDAYTSQLSSKRPGMEVDGKTWTYADIYGQFLTLKAQYPHALLVWAPDYANYADAGSPADYYVVLNGERFATADESQDWCTRNGYGTQDCLPVHLK